MICLFSDLDSLLRCPDSCLRLGRIANVLSTGTILTLCFNSAFHDRDVLPVVLFVAAFRPQSPGPQSYTTLAACLRLLRNILVQKRSLEAPRLASPARRHPASGIICRSVLSTGAVRPFRAC